MTLSFSTNWKNTMPEHLAGNPTHFVEKIWCSLYPIYSGEDDPVYKEFFESDLMYEHYPDFNRQVALYGSPKLHTMRQDQKNRWKSGNKIHFQIWKGKPYFSDTFRFAPILICKSVQKVEIKYSGFGVINVIIDGRGLSNKEIETLAKNDGFNNTEDFFSWFDSDWKGNLIHWTDLKY